MTDYEIETNVFTTRFVQHRITSGYISIYEGAVQLPAFWAHPEIGGFFPGLVLIHGEKGLNSQIRMRVRRYAELGYYVIAPELLTRAECEQPIADIRTKLREQGLPRILAAIEALRTHNRFNGHMGLVGWLTGGELTLNMALTHKDVRAAVVFGGDPRPMLSELSHSDTPLLAFYGDDDPEVLPHVLNQMWESLSQSSVQWQIVVYPGVTNEFKDETSPKYHAHYAADAWYRAAEFLHAHLDPPSVATAKGAHGKRESHTN
ncbi:MAG: dienelactone hydrolase family protein [Anaerolineae bacterium]